MLPELRIRNLAIESLEVRFEPSRMYLWRGGKFVLTMC